MIAADAAQAWPVDLEQVTARLLELPAHTFTSPRRLAQSFDRQTPPPPRVEDCERMFYHSLINDGGRPCYPIDLLEKVASDPVAYNERLLPWQEDPQAESTDWQVFRKQDGSWRRFREWQKYTRKDPRYSKDYFFVDVSLAYICFVRTYHLEGGGLSEYNEAAKTLLAQHGLTKEFQFQEDPMQQGQLTTWIEYLSYECAEYDRYAKTVQRLQPTFEKAWKKLVDSNVLRPSETQEYICNVESSIEGQNEYWQAWQGVESAKSAAEKALSPVHKNNNSPRGLRLTPAERQEMLAAKSRLDKAKELHKSIMKRNQTITEFDVATRDFQTAKRKAKRYQILLRWIFNQVPLIEAEADKSRAVDAGPKAICGMKRRLAHDTSEPNTRHSNVKRKRRYHEEPRRTLDGISVPATCSGPREKEYARISIDRPVDDAPSNDQERDPGNYRIRKVSTTSKARRSGSTHIPISHDSRRASSHWCGGSEESQPRILPPQLMGTSSKIRRRRIAKAGQKQDTLLRSTRHRQPALALKTALRPPQKLTQTKIVPGTVNGPCATGTQARKGSRWSRRLAGLNPEHWGGS